MAGFLGIFGQAISDLVSLRKAHRSSSRSDASLNGDRLGQCLRCRRREVEVPCSLSIHLLQYTCRESSISLDSQSMLNNAVLSMRVERARVRIDFKNEGTRNRHVDRATRCRTRGESRGIENRDAESLYCRCGT